MNIDFDLVNVVVSAGSGGGSGSVFMSRIFKSPIFGD